VTDRQSLDVPGPATYMPSMRAVTADPRVTTVSKTRREGLSTQMERITVNAGPKYACWAPIGCGYPQAQCTFARAPTGRLPMQLFHA